jgi:hypothetical protein
MSWKKELPGLAWAGGILALVVAVLVWQADPPKASAVQPAAYGQSWRPDSAKVQEAYRTSSTSRVTAATASPSKGAKTVGLSDATFISTPTKTAASVPAATDGLTYETYIPRPTKKGYYEPTVVPYPVGKPVYVNSYYRQDGTYVRSHFRSLPRR